MDNQLYESPVYWADLEETYQMVPLVERFFGKKILITGASGMIGSFLTDFFIYCSEIKKGGCEIYAAGRNRLALERRFHPYSGRPYLHLVPYDLEKDITWEFKPDYVIHGAGDADPARFMNHAGKTVMLSVMGAHRLLDYVRLHGAGRLLYLSSGEAYGQRERGGKAISEEDHGYLDTMSARSGYPLGKLAAENVCASFGRQYQMETLAVRLCHTYGPTAVEEDERVASAWFRDAFSGSSLVLKSDGLNKRSYTYVADCAGGILTVLLHGNPYELYNAASDDVTTIRELAESIGKAAGVQVEFQKPGREEQERFNPMEEAVMSNHKLSALGWHGRYPLARGIRHMLKILGRD